MDIIVITVTTRMWLPSTNIVAPIYVSKTHSVWYCPSTSFGTTIVVCLSTSWGIINKSQVDIHLAVLNDKRSSKSATSLSHSHSLTNWYTGYMHDDQ